MVTDNNNSKINYFITGPQQVADKIASVEITQQLDREIKHVCVGGILMFLLQTKPDSKPSQPSHQGVQPIHYKTIKG